VDFHISTRAVSCWSDVVSGAAPHAASAVSLLFAFPIGEVHRRAT
jgi:hypothetical protein